MALVCGLAACNESNAGDGDADGQVEDHVDAAGPDAGNSADASSEPETCNVVAPTSCPEPKVRYTDVEPIFKARCTSCHGGIPGNWPLTEYSHVVSWAQELRDVMSICAMPPVDSGMKMPTAEREKILAWLRCNAPM